MEYTETQENLEQILRNNLRLTRLNAQLQQKEIGEYINVSETKVGRMEQGQRKISAIDLYKLCKLYNVRIEDMFDPDYAINMPKPMVIRMTKPKQQAKTLDERPRKR